MTKAKFIKHSFKRLQNPFEFKIKIKKISRITEASGDYYRYIFWIYLNNKPIKKEEIWTYNITEVKKTIEKALIKTLKNIQL